MFAISHTKGRTARSPWPCGWFEEGAGGLVVEGGDVLDEAFSTSRFALVYCLSLLVARLPCRRLSVVQRSKGSCTTAEKVSTTFWRDTLCLCATSSQGNKSSQVSAMSTMRLGEYSRGSGGVGARAVDGLGEGCAEAAAACVGAMKDLGITSGCG